MHAHCRLAAGGAQARVREWFAFRGRLTDKVTRWSTHTAGGRVQSHRFAAVASRGLLVACSHSHTQHCESVSVEQFTGWENTGFPLFAKLSSRVAQVSPELRLASLRWHGEQEPAPNPESSALEVPDEYSAALDVVAAHARGGRVTMTELRSLLSSSHSAFASWLVGVRQWYRFADLSGRIGLDDLRTAIDEFRSVDTGVQKPRRAPIASVPGGNCAGVSAVPLLPSFVENTAPASFPSEGVNSDGCHHDSARATADLEGDSPLQELKVGEQAKVRDDALRQWGLESDEAEGMRGCSQSFALDYGALEGKISDANLHTGSCEKEPLRKETAWLKPGASCVSALDWASALEDRVSGSAAMHAKALLQGLRDEAPRGPAGTWPSSQACRRQLLKS